MYDKSDYELVGCSRFIEDEIPHDADVAAAGYTEEDDNNPDKEEEVASAMFAVRNKRHMDYYEAVGKPVFPEEELRMRTYEDIEPAIKKVKESKAKEETNVN